jgi:23S rRNA (pseudouridine1915-N3)-methyltransferase
VNFVLLVIGKNDEAWLAQGISEYLKRLGHYLNFEIQVIPDLKNAKNLTTDTLKEKEGEIILDKFNNSDYVILLDDKGKQHSSSEFSSFLEKLMGSGYKRVVFVVGGAFGFSEKVYKRANNQLSLSKMTLTHQMVRLFFVEQLYRAMTIMRGERYHHE